VCVDAQFYNILNRRSAFRGLIVDGRDLYALTVVKLIRTTANTHDEDFGQSPENSDRAVDILYIIGFMAVEMRRASEIFIVAVWRRRCSMRDK